MLSYCDQFSVLFIFIDFTWDFKFSHMTLMVLAFFWLCHVVWQIGVGVLGLLLLLHGTLGVRTVSIYEVLLNVYRPAQHCVLKGHNLVFSTCN